MMISNRLAHHLASLAWAAQRGFHEPLRLVTSVVLACPAHYTVSNLFKPFFAQQNVIFFRNKKMTKIPRLGKSSSPPLVDRLFSHDFQPAGRWTTFVSVCRARMKERWATAVVSSSQPHRWPQFFGFGCCSHQLLKSHSSWSQESIDV